MRTRSVIERLWTACVLSSLALGGGCTSWRHSPAPPAQPAQPAAPIAQPTPPAALPPSGADIPVPTPSKPAEATSATSPAGTAQINAPSAKTAAAKTSHKAPAKSPRPAAAPAVAAHTVATPTVAAPIVAAPPAHTVAARPPSPTLDLTALEQRLKDTHAIGIFTKLSLKNQVDDLLAKFRDFHRTSDKAPPDALRREYEGLMLKVLSLLQDSDPELASAISSSRDAIWGVLIDPEKFAKI